MTEYPILGYLLLFTHHSVKLFECTIWLRYLLHRSMPSSNSPKQNLGQQMLNMTSGFDHYIAYRRGQMSQQQYDIEQQRLNMQQQVLVRKS